MHRKRKSKNEELISEKWDDIHMHFLSLETLEATVQKHSSDLRHLNGLLFNSMLIGSPTQVQYLIDRGADVNVFIFAPASSNRLDILNVVVEHGENVNHADKNGMTPSHVCK